jgi:hypothetical protein
MSESGEGDLVGEAFSQPAEGEHEPREIAARLVADLSEFDHLRHGEASILFLMRAEKKIKAQRMILGELALPRFQGGLAPLASWLLARLCGGEAPDFIMTLDAEWWTQADGRAREALVFHELLHAAHAVDKEGEPKFTEEGLPIWDIRGHDIEEFNEVVRRYGAWAPDVVAFLKAAEEGGAR